MIYKITHGYVEQTFDPKTQKFVAQRFVAGDRVDFENEEGFPIEGDELPYQPFHMIQPE